MAFSDTDRTMNNSESLNFDAENINEELLLKLISSFPAIYDSNRKGYSNRLYVDKAWEHISRSMEIPVDTCKKKWKSLREKYYREKQKVDRLTRSGAGANADRVWPYMSFFNFMFDNREPRETSSSSLETCREDMYVEDPRPSFVITTPVLEPYFQTSLRKSQSSMSRVRSQSPNSSHISTSPVLRPINNIEVAPSTSNRNFIYEDAIPTRINERPINNIKLAPSTSNINSTNENTIPTRTNQRGQKRKTAANNEPDDEKMLDILGQISVSMDKANTGLVVSDKINDFARYLVAEIRDFPVSSQEEFMDETVIRLLQTKRKLKRSS